MSKIYGFEDFEGWGDAEADEVWHEIRKLGGENQLVPKDLTDFVKSQMKVLRILSDFRWHTRIELDDLVAQKETTRRLRKLREARFLIHVRRSKPDSRVFEYLLSKQLDQFPMTRLWKRVSPAVKLLQQYEDWKPVHLATATPRDIRNFVEEHFRFSYVKYEEERLLLMDDQESLDAEAEDGESE